MKRTVILIFFFLVILCSCRSPEGDIYTMGIFQFNDAPTLNEVRRGFLQALQDESLIDGENVHLIVENAGGDLIQAQKVVQEFLEEGVDMIVPFSTPCLQAAMIASRDIPIVFSSIANPYIVGAGNSAEDHHPHVTGVTSRGPIFETLSFIKHVFPEAKRLGTLWTPSEINSEYYLSLAKEGAKELGMEIISVAISNRREIFMAAQVLINRKIDAIYQISDNTINNSFEVIGRTAEENGIPLIGGALYSTRQGACAAMGWDFFEMGYRSGLIAVRIKNGTTPADIPIQSMSNVRLYLNQDAAKKQGVVFPDDILKKADEVIGGKAF
ncbi:MAG: ABC transporter substrate-binding protein [Candidatus Aminicenantes bacterium]|nr:ABC transporter substrate-binding protein [Candidatus Aminicenantes bacterium]